MKITVQVCESAYGFRTDDVRYTGRSWSLTKPIVQNRKVFDFDGMAVKNGVMINGEQATDFEHDDASDFFVEFIPLSTKLYSAYVVEITGHVTELRYWDDPSQALEGQYECEHNQCTPHPMVEHYLPPERKLNDDRLVKITLFYEREV